MSEKVKIGLIMGRYQKFIILSLLACMLSMSMFGMLRRSLRVPMQSSQFLPVAKNLTNPSSNMSGTSAEGLFVPQVRSEQIDSWAQPVREPQHY
jgi:hypothetical protein